MSSPPDAIVSRRRGLACRILVGFALIAGASLASRAQIMDQPPDTPGLMMGKLRVWPFVLAKLEGTDNLFYQDARFDPTSATYSWVQPGGFFELPFSHSYTRFGAGLYRKNYLDNQIETATTYAALSDTLLRFGGGAFFGLRVAYANGVLEGQTADPSIELPFRNQGYWRSGVVVEIGHEIDALRRLGLKATVGTTRYTGDRKSGFYDEDLRRLDASGSHGISPATSVLWDAALFKADQSRPEAPLFPADARRIEGGAIRAGARYESVPGVALEGRVGPADYRYTAPTSSRFRGLIGLLSFIRITPSRGGVNVTLSRDAYSSIFEQANYYVATQIGVSASNDAQARVVLGGTVSYYVNDYPSSTGKRRDWNTFTEAWVGYRLRNGLEFRLSGRYETRRSNLEGLGFNAARASLGMRFGL